MELQVHLSKTNNKCGAPLTITQPQSRPASFTQLDMTRRSQTEILVEAESFSDYGGWTLDYQWKLEMGSPYLMAHGNGKPVADATTNINIAEQGSYSIWVRRHHPGRFSLLVNEKSLPFIWGER